MLLNAAKFQFKPFTVFESLKENKKEVGSKITGRKVWSFIGQFSRFLFFLKNA